ncbi:MAG: hypothetical protein HY714_00755 [Candidatus Omnitrophica bacterium]|nr:hypothetical protein [Candidatus Omnitrophota bacterium]
MNQKGVTLITTFIFLMTLSLMVVGFLVMATGERREVKGRIDMARTFWFAEAGLHKAQWMLLTPPGQGGGGMGYETPTGGVTESLDEGSYTFTVTKTANRRIVVSTGFYLDYKYTVRQEFTVN